jgi:hypothetical protein
VVEVAGIAILVSIRPEGGGGCHGFVATFLGRALRVRSCVLRALLESLDGSTACGLRSGWDVD